MTTEKKERELFDKVISIRLTTALHNKLKRLSAQSNCKKLGEFTRKVLMKEEIIIYHRDASMEDVAFELAAIRKELHSIGVNINQATHFLNGTQVPVQKLYHARQVADEYKKVTYKVDQVLAVISNVQKRWSSKS